MNSPTKQFSWKDRDTAAHDLLQLVYHAPSSVAVSAVSLLRAIRSPNIIPELLEIVEDDQREMWQRIYALRAISATPGDWFLPQLENHMKRMLRKHEVILENHPKPDRAYLGNDMLDDIRGLAANHPLNREWFFRTLDGVSNRMVVRRFLHQTICYHQPEEFRQSLLDYLLDLLRKHPEQITLSVVRTLIFEDYAAVQAWLERHIDEIVEKLLLDPTDSNILSIAYRWEELRETLIQIDANFEHKFDTYITERETRRQKARKENLPDYRQSLAYQHLDSLYQQAADGDKQAYDKLVRVARMWQGNIPLRAAATYFIGRLGHRYNVSGILCYLVKYAQDKWGNDIAPLSPVRAEAGDALKDMASSEVWTAMVDAFFIDPTNVVTDFMRDWIAHVTDVLEGVHTAYAGILGRAENNRPWFRALAEISEEQLQQELV